ncbi:MAG: 4'-phosphopantetheinyl transferase superfamily protein [Oscillospiraceae bacterium]|nr:4'-phosphopantetheinyl transferase superfamily protein [Oscillospiraceae bacterium]
MVVIYILPNDRMQTSDQRIIECVDRYTESIRRERHGVSLSVVRSGNQKPQIFPDIGVGFSVSHSGKYWICALSGGRVGVDLQERSKRHSKRIAERYFHPNECEYISGGGDFFEVWTAKESYVKYTGQGISGGFSSFSVVENGVIADNIDGVCLTRVSFDPNYSLCLCADENEVMTV